MPERDDKTQLIPLVKVAELYGFDQAYLGNLARRGRLKAEKLGSIWVTTKVDVENYVRSRQQKGVYRQDIQLD